MQGQETHKMIRIYTLCFKTIAFFCKIKELGTTAKSEYVDQDTVCHSYEN